MTLADQVTSLELSERLKELGVRQESLFFYVFRRDASILLTPDAEENKLVTPNFVWSAFSAAELGELLPYYIEYQDGDIGWEPELILSKEINETKQTYWTVNYGAFICKEDDNLSNAMAKMLIHLIENNHVKVGDL